MAMKLEIFIYVGLLFFSGSVFAEKYCQTTPSSFSINIENINVLPGAKIGDIVGQSELQQKTTKCSGAPASEVAYTNTRLNIGTGVYVNWPSYPVGPGYTKNCEAMESGFPGLGIAWVNFNSVAGKWVCASINADGQINRGLPINGENIIYDQIFLVKTGVIGNGSGENEVFDFKKTFQFDEVILNGDGSVKNNYGPLYTMTLSGNTEIQAPICTAISASDSFNFDTEDAVSKSYTSSPLQIIEVNCSGVIENGTLASFKPISDYGVFSLDNSYFATSDSGVGVTVEYTENNESTSHTLTPSDDIKVPIINNKATINFKYAPYIKGDSGTYPLDKNIQFNLKLNNGNQS